MHVYLVLTLCGCNCESRIGSFSHERLHKNLDCCLSLLTMRDENDDVCFLTVIVIEYTLNNNNRYIFVIL